MTHQDRVRIYVDADACPVKPEIFTVAERHRVQTVFVANTYLRLPKHALFSMRLVSGQFDAADDWIAQEATPWSVVITSDILLSERCLTAGSTVISPTGKAFTPANIGGAVATRALMQDLRAGVGEKSGANRRTSIPDGPAPFNKADRSRFLSALHETVARLVRRMNEART